MTLNEILRLKRTPVYQHGKLLYDLVLCLSFNHEFQLYHDKFVKWRYCHLAEEYLIENNSLYNVYEIKTPDHVYLICKDNSPFIIYIRGLGMVDDRFYIVDKLLTHEFITSMFSIMSHVMAGLYEL